MPEITVAVVGTSFKGAAAAECIARAAVGYVPRLVREAGNKNDHNAVQVHILGAFVGFVPRAHNSALAAAMDNGAEPTAMVTRAATVERGRVKVEPLITVTW